MDDRHPCSRSVEVLRSGNFDEEGVGVNSVDDVGNKHLVGLPSILRNPVDLFRRMRSAGIHLVLRKGHTAYGEGGAELTFTSPGTTERNGLTIEELVRTFLGESVWAARTERPAIYGTAYVFPIADRKEPGDVNMQGFCVALPSNNWTTQLDGNSLMCAPTRRNMSSSSPQNTKLIYKLMIFIIFLYVCYMVLNRFGFQIPWTLVRRLL